MQSRDHTAGDLWFRAKRDLGDVSGIQNWERFDMMNRAVPAVAGQIYDLLSSGYMTDATVNYASGGKYETGTTGTYTASTHTLALQTPSSNILSTDIDKLVVFRIGTTIYVGKVLSIVSTSSFVFDGDLFPSVDGTLAMVAICDTTVQNDIISLSSLRIYRPASIKIELATNASSVTIRSASQRDLDSFVTSGRNRRTIVWCLNGDSINLKKGEDLTSYGTITIHYPRVPYLLANDSDLVDLADGTAMEIAILYLRGLIQRRLNIPQEDNSGVIQQLLANMYSAFGQEVSAEAVKQKVMALK